MSYAIIETGGKQLRVEPGRFYDIELLSALEDEKVTIQSVLLVQHNGEVTIGQPLVVGATVEGTVMRHLRGRKVLVYKMKPKKKTRKKRGHRQEITRLMINSINLNGSVLVSEPAATAETSEATVPTLEPDVTAETSEATVPTLEPDVTAETPEATVPTLEPDVTAETPEAAVPSLEPDVTAETPEAAVPSLEPDVTAETPEAAEIPDADNLSAETAAE